MPYITAPSQPHGFVGRTYYNANYHHDDGSNWIGIVEEVQPGETEITAAQYEAQWQATHDFNVNWETTTHIPAMQAAIDAQPTMTAAERRAEDQAMADAFEDGTVYVHKPGLTVAERAAAQANLTIFAADVQTWPEPSLTNLHAELMRQANDPGIGLLASTVEALIG